MNEKLVALASAGETGTAAVPATAERLLTLRDLCERLQLSRSTAWRLMHNHGLPVLRVGGLVRVRPSDLDAWLAKNTTASNGGNGEATHDREN